DALPFYFRLNGGINRERGLSPSQAHRRLNRVLEDEEIGNVVMVKVGQNHRIQSIGGTHLGQLGKHPAAAVDQNPISLRLQQISGSGSARSRKRRVAPEDSPLHV